MEMARRVWSISPLVVCIDFTLLRLQAWWSYFANRTRLDGDGRPISFTLKNVTNSTVRDFRIEAPPFWANTVADSVNVTYDGMYSNATNQDPLWKGQKYAFTRSYVQQIAENLAALSPILMVRARIPRSTIPPHD